MYIPDNNDDFTTHEREINRMLRLNSGVFEDEAKADTELPWVDVPNDYGAHDRNLYCEEVKIHDSI
jgi:hypothetical protein